MFAYFCLAGKQFMAKAGDVIIDCPYVNGEVGDVIVVEEVLGINDTIGFPAGQYLKNARVELKIVKQGLRRKIKIVNFKPQKRHEKWKGFRRKYTNLEVLRIHWSK